MYLVIANDGEGYKPLLGAFKDLIAAEMLKNSKKSYWQEIEILRKKGTFAIMHEYSEADSTFEDFVYVAGSEKRARGHITNLEDRGQYSRNSLRIRKL